MSENERGRKLLKDLASAVREKTTVTGEPKLNALGLGAIDALSRDLTGPEGMPGLKLYRDNAERFRLQRERKNAEITVEWQREIGAVVLTAERNSSRSRGLRYLHDEASGEWRRMEGTGELYEDVVAALIEYLYPEAKAT